MKRSLKNEMETSAIHNAERSDDTEKPANSLQVKTKSFINH